MTDLARSIEQAGEKYPQALRLMTHPGVGALTALAFVLISGEAERFQCGKQEACYLGLVPLEHSRALLVSGSGASERRCDFRMAQ